VLLGLLNNVLDVTRAEAGAIEIDQSPFALDVTLSEVLRPQAALASVRGLKLVGTSAPGIVALRIGDRVRVGQILLNLLSNALKFTERGEVAVRVSSGASPDRIRIEVQDSGRGIPADRLESIFEPFTQGTPGRRCAPGRRGPGPRHRARARQVHGRRGDGHERGRQGARRSPWSCGSRPRPRRPRRCPRCSSGCGTRGTHRRHERPAARRSASLGVTTMRWASASSPPSSDGWATPSPWPRTDASRGSCSRRIRSTLLVTDIEMPEMDGLELTRRIREEELRAGRARMPILAATAHVGEDERHRLIAAGRGCPRPQAVHPVEPRGRPRGGLRGAATPPHHALRARRWAEVRRTTRLPSDRCSCRGCPRSAS
jgi:CheY-like chemotaxis protein